MAATSILTVLAQITGLPSGEKVVGPLQVTNVDSPISTVQVTLASGFNSITVPTNSQGCIIISPATATTTKILKGVTGDTGIRLAKTGIAGVLVFDTAATPATIGITSSGLDTSPTEIVFF